MAATPIQPWIKSTTHSTLDPVNINLKGIGIGNGWMSPLEQGKYANYLYYHGLLDSEQFFTLRDLEDALLEMVIFH